MNTLNRQELMLASKRVTCSLQMYRCPFSERQEVILTPLFLLTDALVSAFNSVSPGSLWHFMQSIATSLIPMFSHPSSFLQLNFLLF